MRDPQIRRAGLPFLSAAFRPFFLLASLWSAAALPLWVIVFTTGEMLPTSLPPMEWHIHEMLFGFVSAAIAGFLLTAVANWTGRPPIRGVTLAGLALLWTAGRAANLMPQFVPWGWVAAIDLAFPLVLSALVAREVLAARNWRNLIMPVFLVVFGGADLLMHLEAAGKPVIVGIGWRLALAVAITLIALIGARIIPAFTRNWLAKRGASAVPTDRLFVACVATVLLPAGAFIWAFSPESDLAGFLLIAGAMFTAARLAGWCGWMTLPEPLLAILHIAYLWLIAGTAMLGLSVVSPSLPRTVALHALTAGAIGVMVLAIMTRVCRGHTGRPITADPLTVLIYVAINLAAVLRVAAPLVPEHLVLLLQISAALWTSAYLLFAGWAVPVIFWPRPDGKE